MGFGRAAVEGIQVRDLVEKLIWESIVSDQKRHQLRTLFDTNRLVLEGY